MGQAAGIAMLRVHEQSHRKSLNVFVLYTLSHQELAGKPFPSVQMFDDFPLLLYTSVRLPLVDPHRLA